MENGSMTMKNQPMFKILQFLMNDERKDFVKKSLLEILESFDKNLALNEKVVEKAVKCVLNSKKISIYFLMKNIRCSLPVAEEIRDKIYLLHNEYYRT